MGKKTEVSCSAPFFVILALELLILPLGWVAGLILAAAFHELCHILVLCLLKIRIFGVILTPSGAKIRTGPTEPLEELLSSLAGPLGSFLLLVFSRFFPRLALCGLIQGAYNLLPVGSADGARILKSAVNLLWPNWGQRAAAYGELMTKMILIGWAVWLFLRYQSLRWQILFCLMLILKPVGRKSSCKEGPLAVQ